MWLGRRDVVFVCLGFGFLVFKITVHPRGRRPRDWSPSDSSLPGVHIWCVICPWMWTGSSDSFPTPRIQQKWLDVPCKIRLDYRRLGLPSCSTSSCSPTVRCTLLEPWFWDASCHVVSSYVEPSKEQEIDVSSNKQQRAGPCQYPLSETGSRPSPSPA